MATIVVKTIKSSGGDYTSVTAWEAAIQGDLVAADEVRVGEIYDVNPTSASTIDGSTTDATRYIKLTVNSAYRHAGVYDTGKCNWLLTTGTSNMLTVSDPYTVVEWLQFKNTGATSGGSGIRVTATNVLVRLCIGAGCGTSGGDQDALVATSNSSDAASLTVRNCISYNYRNGLYFGTGNTGGLVENCTLVGNRNTGCKTVASLGLTVKNTYSGGNTNRQYDEGGGATCTNYTFTTSMSSDNQTSKSGLTNNVSYNTTNFTNVTASTEDLHIPSGSALIDAGTDLSGSFTDDIDGVTRSGTWDVGADEYVTAGPGSGSDASMIGFSESSSNLIAVGVIEETS